MSFEFACNGQVDQKICFFIDQRRDIIKTGQKGGGREGGWGDWGGGVKGLGDPKLQKKVLKGIQEKLRWVWPNKQHIIRKVPKQ